MHGAVLTIAEPLEVAHGLAEAFPQKLAGKRSSSRPGLRVALDASTAALRSEQYPRNLTADDIERWSTELSNWGNGDRTTRPEQSI